MNREPLQRTHYQGLRKGGRRLALVAKLVQVGFFGLGLTIFLDQSRTLLSDAQFTCGERNIMGIIALSSLGGCGFAGWVLSRLIAVGADLFDAMADTAESAWRTTELIERQVVPTFSADRVGVAAVGPRTDRAGAEPPGQTLRTDRYRHGKEPSTSVLNGALGREAPSHPPSR